MLSTLGTDLSIPGNGPPKCLLHTPEMVVIMGNFFRLKPCRITKGD